MRSTLVLLALFAASALQAEPTAFLAQSVRYDGVDDFAHAAPAVNPACAPGPVGTRETIRAWKFPGCAVSPSGPNWVSFGPYKTNNIQGEAEARFKLYFLTADPNLSREATTQMLRQNPDATIVNLDVYDYTNHTVVARRAITAAQLLGAFVGEPFKLQFSSIAANVLEYRIDARDPRFDVLHVETTVQPIALGEGLYPGQTVQATTYYPVYFPHQVGTPVPWDYGAFLRLHMDRNAGWIAPVDFQKGQFVTFGPYRNDFATGAALRATFTLALDNVTVNDDAVGELDVFDWNVYAQVPLRDPTTGYGGLKSYYFSRGQFYSGFAQRQFSVEFTNPPQDHKIEFRVRTFRKSWIYHESTSVERIQ